ncbi:membrane protein, putative [Babesia bigemina]|uniref:Membrane protein, putative n=1 Tax=Babesia bigemina TaxID=5866 RepID=A0A061D422_BABBI|nr:membrane protein, putative [Babesia bigemina]CDR95491.1 membrane protein, putative [Babesia bigemina]|eukprot:XP_012767677.1 membrane protein, putative [Babesia bigemina]
MAPPEAPGVLVPPAAEAIVSHPPKVIQYHITLWLVVALVVALASFLFKFLASFERDDPVLYSQLNYGTNQKNK